MTSGTPVYQLAFLDIFTSLWTVKIRSDSEADFHDALATNCKLVLKSPTPAVQLLGLQSFAHFANVTHHTSVIQLTVADDETLQKIVVAFLEKKIDLVERPYSPLESKIIEFLHKCPQPFFIESPDDFSLMAQFDENPTKRLRQENSLYSNSSSEDPVLDDILIRFQSDSLAIMNNISKLNSEQIKILNIDINDFKKYF